MRIGQGRGKRLERICISLFIGYFSLLFFFAAFHRNEWQDWIAYALPAANLLLNATFALPQAGSQYGMDQYWLFSSPLMGLGPWPLFQLLGVGRISYLLGVLLGAMAFLLLLLQPFFRGINSTRNLIALLLLSTVILSHRQFLSSLYNQRYDLWVFFGLLAAFLPGQQPWRRVLQGSLPLLHPALIVAWPILAAKNYFEARTLPRKQWVLYLLPYFSGGILTLIWYARPTPFSLQFLAYARSMKAVVSQQLMPGLLNVPASVVFSLPSIAFSAAVVLAGIWAVARTKRTCAGIQSLVLQRSFVLVVLTALLLDIAIGFAYLPYFTLALAPLVFEPLLTKRWFTISLGLLAAASILISSRLDFRHPSLSNYENQLAFIGSHTKTGDRIVLGPPFVLAAAQKALPGERSITGVVPQPFVLFPYDTDLQQAEVAGKADVYVGSEKFLFDQRPVPLPGVLSKPLFTCGERNQFTFFNDAVVVCRK